MPKPVRSNTSGLFYFLTIVTKSIHYKLRKNKFKNNPENICTIGLYGRTFVTSNSESD